MDGLVEQFPQQDVGALTAAPQPAQELEGEEQTAIYNDEPVEPYVEATEGEKQDVYEEAQILPNNEESEQKNDEQTESTEKRWPGWPGENVFRILVPSQKVGAIIGRKGELIKKTCEETRSRIKILEGAPGLPERAVIISAKEEPDAEICPAMDGLLKIHNKIVEGSDTDPGNVGPTRLLVPAPQAGILIGKQGATIKSIQDASGCVVRVLDTLPPVALADDRVVEIQGDANGMHKAVELIATQLRKFLVDRTVLPLFEQHLAKQNVHRPPMPAQQSWGTPQPWGGHPHNFAPAPPYGRNPQYMPPGPQSGYYPPSDMPQVERQPHYGISTYGRDMAPVGGGSAGSQQGYGGSQVTHNMQVPLSYADAVIGTAGANISYIRRASGATVTIQESRGAPGEMTVEIIGSATQVQTAQQLIQNFMAEAATPAVSNSAPSHGGPASADQGYGSYSSHGYGAPPGGSGPPTYNGSSYGNYSSGYGY